MKCSNCGYRADCACEFENGLCLTCHYGSPKINRHNKPLGDNYCNQTIENLEQLKSNLQTKQRTSLITYQIAVINSQIKMIDNYPCKFKQILDSIQI